MRIVDFLVTVRANQNAFSSLGLYSLPASIRQGPKIELKRLRFPVFMVKFEGCKIPAVAAILTFGALALDQYFLPSSTPLLLRNIGLVAIIGI